MTHHDATERSSLLAALGARVRARRRTLGSTIKALASTSGVSARYLTELENGRGNISIGKLAGLATALDLALVELLSPDPRTGRLLARLQGLGDDAVGQVEALLDALAPRPPLVALLGVRGAGKSSVGARLAARLGMELIELDRLVEEAAGLTLEHVFAIHGQPYYREVEYAALRDLVASGRSGVLATGGSLVTHAETWSLLRLNAVTCWLEAEPEDHWQRVIAQGDDRPMRQNPQAFAQLRALLAARAPLYAQCDRRVQTSARSVEHVTDEVAAWLEASPGWSPGPQPQPASRSLGRPTGSPARRANAVP